MEEDNQTSSPPTAKQDHSFADADGKPNAASRRAATGEYEAREYRLLTVHEVAELLQVPASWVYGRTRKRSLERLPGYRLGKYWRFSQSDVFEWIERQRSIAR